MNFKIPNKKIDSRIAIKIRVTPEMKCAIDKFLKAKQKSCPQDKWNLNNLFNLAVYKYMMGNKSD